MSFDRIIVLSEGRTIYNGRPGDVRDYFCGKDSLTGLPLVGHYCNPADKLISIACHPRRAVGGTLDKNGNAAAEAEAPLVVLEQRCKRQFEQEMSKCSEKDHIRNQIGLNVSTVVEARRVSFFQQYKLILSRLVVQSMRLPLAMLVVVVNGVI